MLLGPWLCRVRVLIDANNLSTRPSQSSTGRCQVLLESWYGHPCLLGSLWCLLQQTAITGCVWQGVLFHAAHMPLLYPVLCECTHVNSCLQGCCVSHVTYGIGRQVA